MPAARDTARMPVADSRVPVGDLVELAEAATAIALSIVLGSLRLVELPYGGSITLAAAPLLLLAMIRGFRVAWIAGWVAGAGHALTGGTVVNPLQYGLDYGLAYGSLACAAWIPGGTRARLALAAFAGCAAQYACSVVSGIAFFGRYAPGGHVVAFSIGYNAAWAAPEALIAAAVLPVLARAWARAEPARAGRHARLRRFASLALPVDSGPAPHPALERIPPIPLPIRPRPAAPSPLPIMQRAARASAPAVTTTIRVPSLLEAVRGAAWAATDASAELTGGT